MNDRPELEPIVTGWLRDEAASVGSDRVLAAALSRIGTVGQERYVTQRLFGDRLGGSRRLRWALVVVLALLVLGGAVIAGSNLLPPRTPPIGDFGPGPSLVTARGGQTTTLLQDGRVLVVGGSTHAEMRVAVEDSAELWDPRSGAATGEMGDFRVIAPPSIERTEHTATRLRDGRVLIVGGGIDPRAEVWDPATESFTFGGRLAQPRRLHTATLLSDGRVLIVGGVSPDYRREIALAEVWDPRTDTFTSAGELALAQGSHTATLLADGHVLVIGSKADGSDPPWPTVAKLWDPTRLSFTDAGTTGRLRVRGTSVLLRDGRLFMVGGEAGDPAEIWDPRTGTSTPASTLRVVDFVQTATLLADGRVLVVGGTDDDAGAAEVWDPATEAFVPTGSIQVVRSGPTATLLADGRVLIAGHWTRGGGITATEIWDPNIEPGPLTVPAPTPSGEPATPPPAPAA